jgi:phage-related protein
MSRPSKPLRWIAAAKDDFMALPHAVRAAAGYALYLAQCGERHPSAKPL